MNWKLSVLGVLLAIGSLTLVVGCEAKPSTPAPAPNTTG
jgi:hypothetical protein